MAQTDTEHDDYMDGLLDELDGLFDQLEAEQGIEQSETAEQVGRELADADLNY